MYHEREAARVNPYWLATLAQKRIVAKDGTGIAYETLGEGTRAIVLANGLGGRLYAWTPAIDALWHTHKIITWDYRGLFDSEAPRSKRRFGVTDHAEDVLAILDAERIDRAVFIGWSMGVQVSLDVAATAEGRVAGLVLINGTYGHAFSTGFQPFVSIPFLPKRMHAMLEWLQDHREVAGLLAGATRFAELPTELALRAMLGARAKELSPLLSRYWDDVLGPSFPNYLRLFQELDAHSLYHLLPRIEAETLVISGKLDMLTPAFQSKEMARRMPHATHLPLTRSSHFSLLERPEIVVPAISEFLEKRAQWNATATVSSDGST
jgi:pimeloyl-ACP methyl ester carboxylesterase